MFCNDQSKELYLFHRAEGWYPLELKNEDEARANAECNPGTLKVTNAITEELVWIYLPEDYKP